MVKYLAKKLLLFSSPMLSSIYIEQRILTDFLSIIEIQRLNSIIQTMKFIFLTGRHGNFSAYLKYFIIPYYEALSKRRYFQYKLHFSDDRALTIGII